MTEILVPTRPEIEKVKALLRMLSRTEREMVRDILVEFSKTGDSEKVKDVYRMVYQQRRPPIDEFIYGEKFLRLPRNAIYPAVMDVLVAADDPGIREVYLCCGKGSGKSTIASVGLARGIYDLLCYVDPAAFFGLMPDDKIAVVNMSIGAEQAEAVLFTKLHNIAKNAPCFQDETGEPTFKKLKRQMMFPKDIHVLSGHSGYQAYFGFNVFVGCLDELSWFKDTRDHSVSAEIHAGVLAAAKTRFEGYFKIYGISSPKAQDDFLFKKVAEARKQGKLVVSGEGDRDYTAAL